MNCYNGEKYLRQSLDSVFAQTYGNWDIVFVDNCSTDDSAAIAASYGDRVRIVRTERNIPLYAARNVALGHLTSDFVTFLDTDDIWHPTYLEKMVGALANGRRDWAYCRFRWVDGALQPMRSKYPLQPFRSVTGNTILMKNVVPMCGIMGRSDLLRRFQFNDSYSLVGDYDLWIRLCAEGHLPFFVDELLADYRVHGSNITTQKRALWIIEERRLYRAFLAHYGLRYPGILAFILKCELGALVRRNRM